MLAGFAWCKLQIRRVKASVANHVGSEYGDAITSTVTRLNQRHEAETSRILTCLQNGAKAREDRIVHCGLERA